MDLRKSESKRMVIALGLCLGVGVVLPFAAWGLLGDAGPPVAPKVAEFAKEMERVGMDKERAEMDLPTTEETWIFAGAYCVDADFEALNLGTSKSENERLADSAYVNEGMMVARVAHGDVLECYFVGGPCDPYPHVLAVTSPEKIVLEKSSEYPGMILVTKSASGKK